MATKLLGLGTTGTVNAAALTLLIDATPPARKRVLIDGSGLADTLATYEAGIEDFSEYMFTQYWEPGDAAHEAIDTLFGSKAEVAITLVYTDTGTTTDTFNGIVSDLEPQPIQKDNLLMRKVTIQRTGDLSRG
jgi:hypothetical protein